MTSLRTVESASKSKAGKILIQLTVGAAAGAAGMMLAMWAMESSLPERPGLDQAIAIGVGLVYALMGVFVGLGTLRPAAGSKLLNVADADELRDDRPYLLMSALACLLVGLSLVALAASGPNGVVAPVGALAILGLATLVIVVLWIQLQRRSDEFRRMVGSQASEVGFGLVFVTFGTWAALAHLAYAPMFTPLAFLAGCYGLVLVASYWIAWRRGMLKQP